MWLAHDTQSVSHDSGTRVSIFVLSILRDESASDIRWLSSVCYFCVSGLFMIPPFFRFFTLTLMTPFPQCQKFISLLRSLSTPSLGTNVRYLVVMSDSLLDRTLVRPFWRSGHNDLSLLVSLSFIFESFYPSPRNYIPEQNIRSCPKIKSLCPPVSSQDSYPYYSTLNKLVPVRSTTKLLSGISRFRFGYQKHL